MGWSMGGAIALQVALNSAHRDIIAGLILECPSSTGASCSNIRRGARGSHLVCGLAIGQLRSEWATPSRAPASAIPFDRLDVVARAAELRHPILILHSDDDGSCRRMPRTTSSSRGPTSWRCKVFEVARHTKLWNYDQERWNAASGRGSSAEGSPPHAAADR